MTYGEIYQKAKEIIGEENIDDYRPAGDFYIDDIVKIIEHEGKQYPTVPMGIRMWLKNGDSVIYVKTTA